MVNSHGRKENISISIKLKEISREKNYKEYFLTFKAVGIRGNCSRGSKTCFFGFGNCLENSSFTRSILSKQILKPDVVFAQATWLKFNSFNLNKLTFTIFSVVARRALFV